MNAAKPVRFTVELTPQEARQLHLLLKRLCFADVLEHTDSGQGREQRTEQAYRMIGAAAKVNEALLEAGA